MAGRVLITGRHGFTGAYVAREMQAAGWQVWGTGLGPAPAPDPRYRQADLTDAAQLEAVLAEARPDAVIHLAAVASVDHGQVADFYRVNLIGTRLLLGALEAQGMGQGGVVLASSANIYGNAATDPITEDTPPAPVNDYALSKLAMEQAARLFADRLPIVVARPFNYTGRGQDDRFLVPKIVRHFRDRAPVIELGNLDVARDFSDVRDVAAAYRALLEKGPRGQVINICSGRATALREVLETCREITGHEIETRVNPDFVRASEIRTLTGDPARLDRITGARPRRGFRETLEWMLSE